MTPEDLLAAAGALLSEPPSSMHHCWQRACATLIRAALERQLVAYWSQVAPSVARSSLRHQLLALPAFAGSDVAAVARSTWYGLCRAVHHHIYELPPTVDELVSWHREVAAVLPYLDPAAVA
jgi:hypothetical protein